MFCTKHYLLLIITQILCFWLILYSNTYADHFTGRFAGNNQRGPGDKELVVKSSNRYNFDDQGNSIVRGGHVPALIEAGNSVFLYFQWFPEDEGSKQWFDYIGVSVSRNSGASWGDPKGVNITGIPDSDLGGHGRPMDPSAAELTDGRIRLYFTLEFHQPHDTVIGDAKIFSAISLDGVNFNFESGTRFEIDDVDLRDPAVVYFKSKWYLYVPDQVHRGTGYHATSSDGLNYVRQEGVSISERGNCLGSATISDGEIYIFGSVWKAYSSNGADWNSGRSRGLGPDPAVIHLKDGPWLAVTFRPMKKEISFIPFDGICTEIVFL